MSKFKIGDLVCIAENACDYPTTGLLCGTTHRVVLLSESPENNGVYLARHGVCAPHVRHETCLYFYPWEVTLVTKAPKVSTKKQANTAPPLTLDWLKVHNACPGGQRRFTNMAPDGSLPMDEMAAHKLFSYHTFSDIAWLLRETIGMDNACDVSRAASGACSVDNDSEARRREYRWRMANACVAAWKEYHR